MYLKRIELKGFKSFLEKTIIEFNTDITVIVGPNGSGKSNITDAFRWVLGENSSKNLRSEKMTNVIFNGSENKKAVSLASVNIVFDNEDRYFDIDYNEVSIERKIFKSGENQYFINKSQCKLKDIKMLLADTGIGVEGYSIIAQGRVEKLLSTNKNDRREIFEEASGIIKYKNSKNIVENNLKESSINLDRINDNYFELKNRLKLLEKQCEKVKRYEFLQNEYKRNEFNIFYNDLKKFDEENYNIKETIRKLEEKKEKIEKKMKDNIFSIKKYNAVKEDIEKQFFENQEKISNLNNNKTKILYKNKLNETNLSNLNEKKAENDVLINELNKKNQILIKKIEKLKEVIINLEKDFDFEKFKKLSKSNESEFFDYNLDEKDKDLLYKKNLYNLVLCNEKLEELKKKNKELEKLKKQIVDIDKEILNVNINLNAKKTDYEYNVKKQDIKLPDSVKFVLEQSENDDKIIGIIKDLFSVEEIYKIAIETALGQALINIVAEDVDTCNNYIKLLRKKTKGRVTFLPLDNIEKKYIKDDYNFDGYIDNACNLINYEKKYENVFSYLISNVYIVEDNDSAKKALKILPKNAKIITLLGDVYIVGGFISGGSNSKNNNLIKLKEIINFYEEELISLDEKRKNLNLKINSFDFHNDLQYFYEKKHYYENIKEKIINEYDYKIKTLENQVILNNENIKSFNEKNDILISTIEDKKKYENDDISNYEDELKILEKEKLFLKEELEKINIFIKTENSDNSKSRLEIDKLNSNINKNILENEKINSQIDSIKEKLFNYDMDIFLLDEYIKENLIKDFNRNIAFDKLKNIRFEITSIGNINMNAFYEYEDIKKRYDFIDNQRNDLILSIDKINSILKDIENNMKDNFLNKLHEINDNFSSIFKELFDGGEAFLEFENNDILNCDIFIKASPKGKKIQNIDLLSGGEKTLTAIALLFAILKTKPSCFCMLDEIEASLDDANIYRFSEFIKKYSLNSQFILVSHRHPTMQIANKLYGVTMQEAGISKVLSINFDEGRDFLK